MGGYSDISVSTYINTFSLKSYFVGRTHLYCRHNADNKKIWENCGHYLSKKELKLLQIFGLYSKFLVLVCIGGFFSPEAAGDVPESKHFQANFRFYRGFGRMCGPVSGWEASAGRLNRTA